MEGTLNSPMTELLAASAPFDRFDDDPAWGYPDSERLTVTVTYAEARRLRAARREVREALPPSDL